MTIPQKIYFDESGFTGNNLLNHQQEIFSYASIATDDEEAKYFVEYLINKYNIQNGELKGKQLVQRWKGREAIDEILEQFQGRIKVSISNKKYALACKFFEYIFEPCISGNNSLFYNLDFHKYIATHLYIEFVAKTSHAEDIFLEFERLMREKNLEGFDRLFHSYGHPNKSSTLFQIIDFAQCNVEKVREEISGLPGDGVGKWILDLTNTALFTLLANWGTEHEQLDAICDESKPLYDDQEIFNIMVARKDRKFITMKGERHPITFNLSRPIQLVNSKVFHGVQLADAIAAAFVHAASKNDNAHATRWKELLPNIAAYGSVIPDIDYMDLKRFDVQRNTVLMLELHSRAKNGKDLLDGLPEYVQSISNQLRNNPIKFDI